MKNITREIIDEGICVVRFDQAGSGANVFNRETLAELEEQVEAIASDGTIRGVVFISAKERVFHAGADLRELGKLDPATLGPFLELGQNVFSRIAALKVPTVAAIHGACVGGGCELALACDWRVATDDRATKIGMPETKLGILPGWGGSTRLPRLIGVVRALDVILGGKTPGAKQALKFGMIDAIAPREYLLRTAVAMIEKRGQRRMRPLLHCAPVNWLVARVIAPRVRTMTLRRTRGHYPAISKALGVILAAPMSSEAKSLARERRALLDLAGTEACGNLMRLFLQQECARKSSGTDTPPIARVAVIGAGVMGSAIAQWFVSRGVRVLLRDVDADRVAAGMERIRKLLANRRVFSAKEARDAMDRVSPVTADVPFGRVDLVIEAAVENLDAKKQIFAHLDEQAVNPSTLLATNTSALSVAGIAAATRRPGRVVGIHFFNPVHKMQLVEVAAPDGTGGEAAQRAMQFVRQIGKLPVLVKDSPGFLVNRVLLPYLVEAGLLFETGASVENIDRAMLDFGMPMGPLRLIDEVGVDVAADVAGTLAGKFSDRMSVPLVLARMIEAEWLGRKNGRGFYIHDAARRTSPNAGLDRFRCGGEATALERPELQIRLALLMVNEAARCVEEKVVATAAEVDFAMVMGAGFAPFRGGPLRFAEAMGLDWTVKQLSRLAEFVGPRYAPCAIVKQLAASRGRFHED